MTVMDKNISQQQENMKDLNQTTDTDSEENSGNDESTNGNGYIVKETADAMGEKEGNQTDIDINLEDLTTEHWIEKLAEVETLAAERLEGQQRALADFQNFKRRKSQEIQLAHQNAAAELLSQFFPIVHDLHLALESLPNTRDGATWSEGFNMIHRKIMSVFEREKVLSIKAEPGDPFDPHIHEAIIQEAHDDYNSDVIISMVRPGYLLGERVLRPAQVRVAE
jgi:molecular chaperone GrpE